MQALARRLATAPLKPRPDRPVAITLTITDLDVGGAERVLVAIATGLDRRRWTPSVVCLGSEGALVEPLRSAGIETICLGVSRRKPIGVVTRLAKVLKRLRPEIVQSFLFHANLAAKLAAPIAGTPWVVGGLRVAERQRRWHLVLDRLTSRLSAGSVCVSEGVRRFSVEVGGLDPDRLTVIPNGIDPAPIDAAMALDRATIGVPADATLALFVGRLDPQKGLPILLEAADQLGPKGPDWRLVLVGDGPDREPLHAMARSLPGLDGRVIWLGRRDDVPSILKAADLFILPSLWEGMPNVVLEAMAARRAVIGTRVEGTEDLVVPGETGWLIPPSEVRPLADALGQAIADPDRLRRFGEAGRTRVEERFKLQNVRDAYVSLWSFIISISNL